ncbi:MAG: putative signal transducing protein [Bacteroidia bacterium]
MKDWVCIYTSQKLQDAEMTKGLLSFNEINSVVINKQDSSYNMFGYFEVYVNREDAVKAKYVIDNNPSS